VVKLIVGLGNPGAQYENTRHNVGFKVVDLLARRWRMEMTREKFHAWFDTGLIRGEQVALLKPTKFMNRSGQSVQAAGKFYQLQIADLLTITDDTALELGRLRMRMKGSSGGHNGLQDIIDRIGTHDFCRLRLGVGAPLGNRVNYVLSEFAADEQETLDGMIQRAADAAESWIVEGGELAMNRVNVNT
jgi:PTH1 family peptidyl-tRNA hydrolase